MTDEKNGDGGKSDGDGTANTPMPPLPPQPPGGGKDREIGGEHEGIRNSKAEGRRYFFPNLSTPEWVSALASVAAVIVAALSVVVSCETKETLDAQLREMKSGGTDTHNLASATGGLVKVYTAQEGETQKLRKATESFATAMNTEATNTGGLVDQAKRSAEYARESLVIGERPYVMFGPSAEWRPRTDPPTGRFFWAIYVPVTNYGNTLARDLSVRMTCKPVANVIKDDPWGKNPFPKGIYSYSELMPAHAPPDIKRACIVHPEDVARFNVGKGGLAVMGRAEYRDIVSPKVLHVTEFCLLQYQIVFTKTGTGGPEGACLRHNCQDEQCRKQ